MSGFEVAGVVLAVFPLLVNGLQRFAEGVETIKSWKRYHRELSNYVRTLETQGTYCQDTIEELFDGIIHSDDEYNALKEDPGGALWRQPQYEGQLRRRLNHSYKNYMETMINMLETLKDVRRRLGMDDLGKVRSPVIVQSNLPLANYFLSLVDFMGRRPLLETTC